jgi:branched-chain amino acid transport system ATP-binding protein
LGGNGAGKSTTQKAILGFVRPKSGQITFEGARLDTLSIPEIIKKGITMVPEGRRVFPFMEVRENLLLGGWVRRKHRAEIKHDFERVLDLFPILGKRLNQLAGTMSGGEQQMVAMARALMMRPKLVLMDEPTMGLAPKLVDEVLELIQTVNRDGIAVLLVEQNARTALGFTDRAYVMERGRLVIEGPSKDLLSDERVRSAYLGELNPM